MKKLLISFAPGARGDFLANILTGRITSRIFTQFKLDTPHYIKMHNIQDIFSTYAKFTLPVKIYSFDELFNYCKDTGITTVRIAPGSVNDLVDIAYFIALKIQKQNLISMRYVNYYLFYTVFKYSTTFFSMRACIS